MNVAYDNLWLCSDCTIAAVNGDTNLGQYYGDQAFARESEILAGLERLGPQLVMGNASMSFSDRTCDCCGSELSGERQHFLILEADNG